MKTYTLKEYGVEIGKPQNPRVLYSASYDWCCGCTRAELRIFPEGKEGRLLAYEDCPRCLGMGADPIPLSDLR